MRCALAAPSRLSACTIFSRFLPALTCLLRSITLRMTMAPVQRTWPELIPLLQSGRLDVDGIFTTTLPLDEAAKGYATARARSGEELKVLLTP